jgi:hypothetical protein
MTDLPLTRLDSSGALRFSGHETFACRYAWLPKAYRALTSNPTILSDEDAAMVELGLGKNMVKSLRFWVEATGIAQPVKGRGLVLTDFAHAILESNGFDPYLEDIRTLWLLHWQLSSRLKGGLFAWRFLLNHWPFPEFTRSEALAAFVRESAKLGHSHSVVTLSQHFDAFLHTYHSTRSASVGIEDSLDGPLVDLGLLQSIGRRIVDGGRWETVYSFRREPKPEITSALFEYCVSDFWARFREGAETMTLREVALGICSPGQVFKLSEDDVRARLETCAPIHHNHPFTYQPSAVQGLLSRRKGVRTTTLTEVYEQRLPDA